MAHKPSAIRMMDKTGAFNDLPGVNTGGLRLSQHGRGIFCIDYTPGTETSIEVHFEIRRDDGTWFRVKNADKAEIPIGGTFTTAAQSGCMPLDFGGTECVVPGVEIRVNVEVTGVSNGTTAVRVDLFPWAA